MTICAISTQCLLNFCSVFTQFCSSRSTRSFGQRRLLKFCSIPHPTHATAQFQSLETNQERFNSEHLIARGGLLIEPQHPLAPCSLQGNVIGRVSRKGVGGGVAFKKGFGLSCLVMRIATPCHSNIATSQTTETAKLASTSSTSCRSFCALSRASGNPKEPRRCQSLKHSVQGKQKEPRKSVERKDTLGCACHPLHYITGRNRPITKIYPRKYFNVMIPLRIAN